MTRTERPVQGGRLVLTLLLLGSTFSVMAGAILAPVLDLIRRDFELGATATGLVLTVHAVSLAVVSPVVGRLIDRHGTRPVLAAGLVLYGVAGGAGLVTEDLTSLVVSRLVFGVGVAAVFTGTTVALLELFHGPRRDQVMGWRASAFSVGGVVWPLLGGVLGTFSWHGPFAVYLLGVPLGVALLVAMPATEPAAAPTADAAAESFGTALRRDRRLLAAYAIQLLAALLLYAVLIFVPLRLAEMGPAARWSPPSRRRRCRPPWHSPASATDGCGSGGVTAG